MSRSERLTWTVRETKLAVRARDGGQCFVCEVKPGWQLSHILPQDDLHIGKYGAAVIHHPLNQRLTCGIKCNRKVQINCRSRPVLADEHAERIIEAILRENMEEQKCPR